MVEVTTTVVDTLDDGFQRGTSLTTNNDFNLGIHAGNSHIYGVPVTGFVRFQSVALSQGQRLRKALLKININNNPIAPLTTIYGVDEDNAAQFSSPGNRPNDATTTTASLDFDPTTSGLKEIDVTDIVQEIIDRTGWSSGNALAFVIKDRSSPFANGWSADGYGSGGTIAELEVTYVLDSRAGNLARVELYDSDGSKSDNPPVFNVIEGWYEQGLEEIGAFEIKVPLTDDSSRNISHGQDLWFYVDGEGLVFKGKVDGLRKSVLKDEPLLVVKGSSIARSLVHENAGIGLEYDNASLSSAVSTALTGTGWSSGSLDTPSTNLESKRFDGQSIWAVLGTIARVFGLYLREDVINQEIDINSFGTNPNGLLFANLPNVVQDNDELSVYPINGIGLIEDSGDVWTKVIPLGQREGIVSNTGTTLANSDRTSPYTPASETGPNGEDQWYISDAAAISTYGTRTKVLQIKDVFPLGLTDTDFERASNTLCDLAATWLTRHKDKQEAYDVRVIGLPHLSGGSPLFQVGDKVQVLFKGYVKDLDGNGLTYLDIDKDLYIMRYKRTFKEGGSNWTFQLATIARSLDDDGNRTAEFIEKVTALESAPLPFILFGDNILRIDSTGIQLKTEGATQVSIWGLDEFSATPANNDSVWRLGGYADDAILASGVNLSLYKQGTEYSRLALSYGSFNHAELWAADQLGLRVGDFGNGASVELERQNNLTMPPVEKTISSGAIAPTGIGVWYNGSYTMSNLRVDTQSNASTDDLDTLTATGINEGHIALLGLENASRIVTVKHNTGNILMANEADFELSTMRHKIAFIYDGSDWREIFRVPGGGDGPVTYNTFDTGFLDLDDFDNFLSGRDNFTLTNPGTSLTTVFDVEGKGTLTVYFEKPETNNSVAVHAELTIDDVVVINDVAQHSATTFERNYGLGMLIGDAQSTDDLGVPGDVIRFNKNCKLRLRYSSSPGANENITGGFRLQYA